jgi:hypothetical protein
MGTITFTARRRKGSWTTHTKKGKPVVARAKKASWRVTRKDVGRRGLTPKSRRYIPPVKKGALGVDFDWSAEKRRRVESKLARKEGEKSVVGKLRAIQVFNKNVNPELSRKAKSDADYIAGTYRGKKRVGYPKGFRRVYGKKEMTKTELEDQLTFWTGGRWK